MRLLGPEAMNRLWPERAVAVGLIESRFLASMAGWPARCDGVADRYGHAKAMASERAAAIHAALETLGAPTRRFVKRLMDGQKPLESVVGRATRCARNV